MQKKYRLSAINKKRSYKQDLVKQQFRPEDPNVVWAGDITYIKTKIGWVCLAIVMDLYNREVIGYATSQRIDPKLVKRALGEAVGKISGDGRNHLSQRPRMFLHNSCM